MMNLRLLFAFLCGLTSIDSASAQLYTMLSPRFSSFIEDDGNYTPREPIAEPKGSIPRDLLTDGLLYFSFAVQINEETLKYLVAKRRLEVKCSIYVDGSGWDSVEIGITPANWEKIKKAVVQGVRQNGIFNWRTYMNTERVDAQTISIIVKDGRGQVVKPIGFPGSYEANVQLIAAHARLPTADIVEARHQR